MLILRGNQTALADIGNVRDNERETQEQREPRLLSPASQQAKDSEALRHLSDTCQLYCVGFKFLFEFFNSQKVLILKKI